MEEPERNLRAEKFNDKMFKIFNEDEGEKEIFTVNVYVHERWFLMYAMCDECYKIALGIGYEENIYILGLADNNGNPVKVNALQFVHVVAAIKVCSELQCWFICNACADKEKLNAYNDLANVDSDNVYQPRYGQPSQ